VAGRNGKGSLSLGSLALGSLAFSGASFGGLAVSSSAMILRMEARISSIEGS
jgi:hypothetical protein